MTSPGLEVAERPARQRPEPGLEGLLVTAWVASTFGIALVVVGLVLVGVEAAVGSASGPITFGTAAAIGGGLLTLGGLATGSVRSIILRRKLSDDRYRGPSVLMLLAMVIVTGTLVSLPFLGGIAEAIAGARRTTPLESLVLLLGTSVPLLVVSLLFVALPRALPGVSLLERGAGSAAWSIVIGVLIAGPAWLVIHAFSAAITPFLSELLGVDPELSPQLVGEIAASLNPLLAFVVVAVVAPVAEEIFFRGVVFNAWEREYGYWRALIGSSLLFAVIHAEILVLVPIFLLALMLGYVYARTRSLLTVIGLHATFNAISMILLFLLTGAG